MARLDDKILQQVAEEAELTPSYLTFMAMAGILAAVGMLANSVPILVGSMIVAPAFAPLALVAFALVGGQLRLALRGLGIGLLGLLVATICAMLTTWVMNVTSVIPPETNLLNKPLLEERVQPGWYSLVAAFAAGVVGTIAQSKQKTDTLVGTVAALALVPAAAATGIAFISREPQRALGGLVLLGVNVGLIIAMGMLTLLTIVQFGKSSRTEGSVGRESAEPKGKSWPAWALSLVALVLIALVLAMFTLFTFGPGKGLSEPSTFSQSSLTGQPTLPLPARRLSI